jgi:hypothetical protein
MQAHVALRHGIMALAGVVLALIVAATATFADAASPQYHFAPRRTRGIRQDVRRLVRGVVAGNDGDTGRKQPHL